MLEASVVKLKEYWATTLVTSLTLPKVLFYFMKSMIKCILTKVKPRTHSGAMRFAYGSHEQNPNLHLASTELAEPLGIVSSGTTAIKDVSKAVMHGRKDGRQQTAMLNDAVAVFEKGTANLALVLIKLYTTSPREHAAGTVALLLLFYPSPSPVLHPSVPALIFLAKAFPQLVTLSHFCAADACDGTFKPFAHGECSLRMPAYV
eukprot:6207542-Pleurochrysis_carterae.AAC.1